MAFTKINNTKINTIAAAVPKNIYQSKNYDWITEEERKQFIDTTGIEQRRYANLGVCTSDLAVDLCKYIFDTLKIDKSTIDALVFVSQSRDYVLPNTACIIQDRLSLPKSCLAFDVPLGCSGYPYGISILSSIISASGGSIRKGLLIAGDVSSSDMNFRDKTTWPLFGDAVSVTIIEYDVNNSMPMYFDMQTDGSGYSSLIIPDGAARNKYSHETLEEIEYAPKVWRSGKNVVLEGLKIFEFTIHEVASNILSLLKQANIDKNIVDYYVLHQANKLMNETVRKQLKASPEQVPYSLNAFGNTSSASIPLTIVASISEKVANKNFVFSGFGVGLSWSSMFVKLNTETVILPLLEV